jgi:hypothetical protein
MVADDADMSVNNVTKLEHRVVKDALCRYRCRCRYTEDGNRRYSITVFPILLSEYHIHKRPRSLRDVLCILHDFRGGDCITLSAVNHIPLLHVLLTDLACGWTLLSCGNCADSLV